MLPDGGQSPLPTNRSGGLIRVLPDRQTEGDGMELRWPGAPRPNAQRIRPQAAPPRAAPPLTSAQVAALASDPAMLP
jgi:hypothetical protein